MSNDNLYGDFNREFDADSRRVRASLAGCLTFFVMILPLLI